jgi:hypothetical protein
MRAGMISLTRGAIGLVLPLLLLPGMFPSSLALAAQERDFPGEYQKLETLEFPSLKRGDVDAHRREERAIRDYFIKSGDAGARFLVGKLKEMNDDERQYLHGSEQFDIRVTQYMQLRMERGESNLLKYSIGFILADMFPHTTAETQTMILRELASSYTPSTYGREDRQFLDFALNQIGRPGVPYFIQVAGHNFPTVRCGAMASLTGLAETAKKASLPDAPKLDCNAPAEQRQVALNEWKAWWEKNGGKVRFPRLPSFFDIKWDDIQPTDHH